jgi:hypothetical protein
MDVPMSSRCGPGPGNGLRAIGEPDLVLTGLGFPQRTKAPLSLPEDTRGGSSEVEQSAGAIIPARRVNEIREIRDGHELRRNDPWGRESA